MINDVDLKKLKSIGISHSRKSTWSCRKKFWYTINNWYNPSSSVTKNAYFGNLIHHLAELVLPNYKAENHNITFYHHLCREYDNRNAKDLTSVDPNDLEKDKGLAISVFMVFVEMYFSENENVLSKLKKSYRLLKSELYLKRQKVGKHVYNIKIDQVLQKYDDKKIYLLDFKCKSQIDEYNLLKLLSFEQQLFLYAKGFEARYQKKVAGIYQLLIRKPGLRMGKKDNDDFVTFIKRVAKDVEEKPDHYFKPLFVFISDKMMETFTQEENALMNEIYTAIEQGESAFYKNTQMCLKPFTCDFIDACANGGDTGLLLKHF